MKVSIIKTGYSNTAEKETRMRGQWVGCRSSHGHCMCKRKATQWVMQGFFRHTTYQDVAEFCLSCQACQFVSFQRAKKAPLYSPTHYIRIIQENNHGHCWPSTQESEWETIYIGCVWLHNTLSKSSTPALHRCGTKWEEQSREVKSIDYQPLHTHAPSASTPRGKCTQRALIERGVTEVCM